MRDDLRIAVSDEPMSARPQLVSSLDVIKQLAVEDYRDVAVFVKDRLLAIGQTDNTQPARSQAEPGSNEKTLFVRAAMQQRAGHSLHAPIGNGTLSHQIDGTSSATTIPNQGSRERHSLSGPASWIRSTSSIRSFSASRRAKLLTWTRSIVCCWRRRGRRSKTPASSSISRRAATSASLLAFRTMIIRECRARLPTTSGLRPTPLPAARTRLPRIEFLIV